MLFGARNRDDWGTGLTILTALANLLPTLPPEQTYLALYQGISRVARDCDGQPPGATAIRLRAASPCRCCGAGCGTGPGCGIATGPNGHC